MKKMKDLTPIVRQIMEKVSLTRSDDDFLYLCILKHLGYDVNNSVENFLWLYRKQGFPTMETVCRLRRMIQAEHPELRADENTTNRRKRQEEEIHEFFKKE